MNIDRPAATEPSEQQQEPVQTKPQHEGTNLSLEIKPVQPDLTNSNAVAEIFYCK